MRSNPPARVPHASLTAARKTADFKTALKGNLFKLQMKEAYNSIF